MVTANSIVSHEGLEFIFGLKLQNFIKNPLDNTTYKL